jgi:hypothetical protein
VIRLVLAVPFLGFVVASLYLVQGELVAIAHQLAALVR